MKGTVRRRASKNGKGSWSYQIHVARASGRRFITKGGFRTRRECETALTDALAAWERGTHVEPSKVTVGDFLEDEWLSIQERSKKPSTYHGYRHIVEKRLVPHLGDVRLSELTTGDVASFYTTLRTSGRKDGQGGLSERTIKHTHAVLHSALEHAVDAGILARNVAARLPKGARPKPRAREMKVWSADELRAFLAATAGDRLAACWTIAATTGLRRSELCGLRWDDLDIAGHTLAVRRGRVAAGYDVHEREPKSGRARVVALDDETVKVFRRHRSRQLEEKMQWGAAWDDTGYVFTAEDGRPIHPHSISNTFDRSAKAAGVSPIRFHDLRHTAATLLLQAGVHPKVVQERLGHSSIQITLDLYSHVVPGMQEEAAEKLGALIFGAV